MDTQWVKIHWVSIDSINFFEILSRISKLSALLRIKKAKKILFLQLLLCNISCILHILCAVEESRTYVITDKWRILKMFFGLPFWNHFLYLYIFFMNLILYKIAKFLQNFKKKCQQINLLWNKSSANDRIAPLEPLQLSAASG